MPSPLLNSQPPSSPLHPHRHQHHPPHTHYTMFLKQIIFNGLYSTNPFKQVFVAKRIFNHFCNTPMLSQNGIEIAYVTYVPTCPIIRTLKLTIYYYSSTGWHYENHKAKTGSHVTIKYLRADNSHYKTLHIYCE